MKNFIFLYDLISVFASQKYEFELNGSFKEITKTLPDKVLFQVLILLELFLIIGKYRKI